jgi:methanethiol S-methyltransferase
MFGLIYSVCSYLLFLAVFNYFAFFSAGVLVPRTVDVGLPASVGQALLIDCGLILLFGLQHSIMARHGFKQQLTRLVSERLERATFVLASSAALVLLMWQWRPIGPVIFSVQNPTWAAGLWLVNALGWLGVPASSFMIDHFDLFGVKQALHGFRRSSYPRTGFITPWFYKSVRHPMMTSLLVAFWVTPHMTIGHFVLSVGMSVYILVGVHFEERALAKELGDPYLSYQDSTPKFFPLGRG